MAEYLPVAPASINELSDGDSSWTVVDSGELAVADGNGPSIELSADTKSSNTIEIVFAALEGPSGTLNPLLSMVGTSAGDDAIVTVKIGATTLFADDFTAWSDIDISGHWDGTESLTITVKITTATPTGTDATLDSLTIYCISIPTESLVSGGTMTALFLSGVGSTPRLNRRSNLRWFDNLVAYGYATCPLERTTTYYIAQNGSGSDTGGGGAGTYASPYLVKDLTDLNTLIASLGNDVRIRLRDRGTAAAGHYFRVNATTPVGLTITNANVTIDSYSATAGSGAASVRNAVLLGSTSMGRTGWTQDGVNTTLYYKALAYDPHQIFTGDGTAEHQWNKYLDTIGFRKYASGATAAIAATLVTMNGSSVPSFCYDTTLGRLYVKVPTTITAATTMPVDIEAVKSTSGAGIAGITVGSGSSALETVRLDRISAHGFGDPDGGHQKWIFQTEVGSNTIVGVTRCRFTHSLGYHVMGSIDGGTGATAPYAIWTDGVELGWSNVDSIGNAVHFVGYCPNGKGQFVLKGIRGIAGSYPSTNIATPVSCDLIYSHVNGATLHDLVVCYACGWDRNATLTMPGYASFGNLSDGTTVSPTTSPYTDTSEYRILVYKCVSFGTKLAIGTTYAVFINSEFRPTYPAASFQQMVGVNVSPRVVAFNTIWALDGRSATFSSSSFPFVMFNGVNGSTAVFHMVFSAFVWRLNENASGTFSAFLDVFGEPTVADDWALSQWWNSIVGGTLVSSSVIANEPVVGGTYGGGATGCAFTPASLRVTIGDLYGYDGTGSLVELQTFPFEFDNALPECVGKAVDVTTADLLIDYDRYGFERTNSDIGPSHGVQGDLDERRRQMTYIFD